MPKPALGFADHRPRYHVWLDETGFSWSVGPTGLRNREDDIGLALIEAVAHSEGEPCVIIYEGADVWRPTTDF